MRKHIAMLPPLARFGSGEMNMVIMGKIKAKLTTLIETEWREAVNDAEGGMAE